MARLEFARIAGAALLALALLLPLAAARADTSGSATAAPIAAAIDTAATDAATAADAYLPLPRTMAPEVSTSRIAAKSFPVRIRIDTPEELNYYRHGGILPYVLRNLMK